MKKKLTPQELDWLLDDAFNSIQIDQTIEKIWGRSGTRRQLNQYLKDNPEVKAQFEEALTEACPFLENDILNCHKKMDPKEAELFSRNVMRILEVRKPEKYGKKVDLNLNQTISIRGNLEQANKRVAELLRDVTPVLIKAAMPEDDGNKE